MKKLLKFSASWCGPCKALSMTIASAGDLGVAVEEIDIDENGDLAAQYKVRGVPTLVLLDGESEVARKVGTMTATQLKEFING